MKGLNYNELHLFGIDMIFNDLNNYQNLIESFLEKQKQQVEKDFNESDIEAESKKADENSDAYYLHLIDFYSERHHEIARLFPHNFRASFLTQTISVIESELKKICDHFGNHKRQLFRIDDMKGTDDLEKCKDYLKRIAAVSFDDLNVHWQYIKHCKGLRNKIVHQEGRVKISDHSLVNFIRSCPSLEVEARSLNSNDHISFVIADKILIDNLLTAARSFFIILLREKIVYSDEDESLNL
jgi:hypothetical protein